MLLRLLPSHTTYDPHHSTLDLNSSFLFVVSWKVSNQRSQLVISAWNLRLPKNSHSPSSRPPLASLHHLPHPPTLRTYPEEPYFSIGWDLGGTNERNRDDMLLEIYIIKIYYYTYNMANIADNKLD